MYNECTKFFSVAAYQHTIGHIYKIYKQSCRLNVSLYSFAKRVIDIWNNLPIETVLIFLLSSTAVFKKKLDQIDYTCCRGYWRQWADEMFGDPPPKWIQEPSMARDRDGRPPRGPHGSALLLCV